MRAFGTVAAIVLAPFALALWLATDVVLAIRRHRAVIELVVTGIGLAFFLFVYLPWAIAILGLALS